MKAELLMCLKGHLHSHNIVLIKDETLLSEVISIVKEFKQD